MTKKIVELTLEGMAYGGDAIGRDASGRMVFIPFGLPGEKVRVTIVEEHKRWARGRLQEIIESSSERITARCPHFAVCGSCHYQHMSYAGQLRVKQSIVCNQLERLGGFTNPPVEPIVASPSPWQSRNKVQFHLTPEGKLAYHGAFSPRLVAIDECHTLEPALAELWPRLDLEAVHGLRRVTLRSGTNDSIMIILEGESNPDLELSLDFPASVVWLGPGGVAVLAGSRELVFEIKGRSFVVSAPSFFQVNTALIAILVESVLALMQVESGETILDLYAGVGLFSAFMAEAGGRVIAVEESPWACSDFEINLDSFDDVSLYEATVEQALPSISIRPDAALIDPPRSGLSKPAMQALLDIHPPHLVYVSCDLATMARDGRELAKNGYQLERITPFDLFPQTYHIETVSLWRR